MRQNEARTVKLEGEGPVTVTVHKIIGTNIRILTAWKTSPVTDIRRFPFSTICHRDGKNLGQIGTEVLPAEIEALPARSAERSKAVRAFHNARGEVAIEAIFKAFPEAEFMRPRLSGGFGATIEVVEG